jgi:hypothetical protein
MRGGPDTRMVYVPVAFLLIDPPMAVLRRDG